jgi:hypothetical protein
MGILLKLKIGKKIFRSKQQTGVKNRQGWKMVRGEK